jgi:hypothetical protein
MTVADLVGVQDPRVWSAPPFAESKGQVAIDLAARAGLNLDVWQQFVLINALGVREQEDEEQPFEWVAFEVGVDVTRQNGKGSILEARELAGVFEFGDRLLIHTAHEFATSLEAFLRFEDLVAGTAEFSKEVKRVSRSHGDEGIDFKSGQRIRFRTRTKGGGRGFSADFVALDEAMQIPTFAHGALLPTLSARPNPQVWYTGSAVDQEIHDHGVVFARVRERGHAGTDPRLAYFEWSLDADLEDIVAQDDTGPEEWARSNPGLGIRISPDHVATEQRSMDRRTFAVERLGVGDWPDTDASDQVIPLGLWQELYDASSIANDQVCFAVDVSPDRSSASIGVAGTRADGRPHLEVLDRRRGTGWVCDRTRELTKERRNSGVVCDGAGPVGALIPELTRLGVKVIPINANEHAQACGMFYDAVDQEAVRHNGEPQLEGILEQAIKGASTRPLGDAWAWSRKNSGVDISPLVVITLAHWGLQTQTTNPFFAFA